MRKVLLVIASLCISVFMQAQVAQPIVADANTLVLDHFDNSSSGQVVGSLGYTQSVSGLNEAADFSLVGSFAMYPITDVSLETSGTIEMWINLKKYNTELLNINWNNTTSTPSSGFIGRLSVDSTGRIDMANWGWSISNNILGNGIIPLNTWTHIAISWADSSKIYINGKLDLVSALQFRPAMQNPCYVYLPDWGNGVGYVDELHISNIQRTAAEIASRMPKPVTTYNYITTSACGSYTFNGSTYTQSGTYSQTLVNIAGGDSIVTLKLTINQIPAVIIQPVNAQVCIGTDLPIIATVAGSTSTSNVYVWSGSGTTNLSAINSSAVIFNSKTTGSTLICNVTDMYGCVGSASATVIVNPSPIVAIIPSASAVCAGGSVTLSAATAATYKWNTGDTTAKITKTPTATSTFTVTGTNPMGCFTTASTTITVNPLPIVKISSSATTINAGSSVTLTASGATTFTWSNGATTAGISATPTASTNFSVTGTDANTGCSNTASLAITVQSGTTAAPTAPNFSFCQNSTATAIYAVGTNLKWYTSAKGDSLLASQANPIPNTTVVGKQYYYVSQTVNNIESTITTVTVIINSIPVVTISPANGKVCAGNDLQIIVQASGSTGANTTYSWTPATNLKIGSPASSAVFNSTITGTNAITCNVTDMNGCIGSATTIIVVNPSPTVTITPSAASVCAGSSVTLYAATAATYKWNTGDTIAKITKTPTATSTFTVTGTNPMGCSTTASTTVTVNLLPSVKISSSATTINAGSSVTLTASGANIFTWSNGATTAGISATPTASTTFSVTGTDANTGCSNTASLAITVQGTTVVPVQKMSILDGSQSIQLGQSFTFHAQITPANATSQQYIWYYLNALDTSKHAVLSDNSGSTYTYAPTQAGVFFLYVFSSQYYTTASGKQIYYHDSVKVAVTQHIAVSSISVNIDSLNVTVGKADNSVVATISPSNAANKGVKWVSGNPAIAQVDSVSGVITGVSSGVAKITVYSLDNASISASFTVKIIPPPVDRSALQTVIQNADNIIAKILSSSLGTAAGQYSPALMDSLKAHDASAKVVLNANTVSQNVIDATTAALKEAITKFSNSVVNAVSVTSIALNATSVTLSLSTTQYLLTPTILPATATNKTLSWSSSNTSVVKVDNNGVVSSVGGGTAVVTVSATDGSGKSVSCTFTVTVPVSSISMTETIGLTVGGSGVVKAYVLPTNATNTALIWSSSDTSIASVNPNGVVTAKKVGSAKIVAQSVDGQKTAVCIANISAKVILMTAISLPETLQMIIGTSQQIQATITPFNATDQTIIWQSSNIASLTVDYQGIVQALSVGTITVYAFNQDKSLIDSTIVYVIPSLPPTVIPVVAPITVKTGTQTITVALNTLVSDSTTSLSNLTFVPETNANFTVAVVGDSLVITPTNPQTPATGTITVVVSNQNKQSSTIVVPVVVSAAANSAPVLMAIPSQSIIVGGTFAPIALSQYVTDDYTKPADIVWTVADNSHFQAAIINGILSVIPSNGTWTGTDSLLLKATDQSGASVSIHVSLSVSNKPNQAPVLAQIPVQTQTSTVAFQPIVLTNYVTDDYTPSSYITWTASTSTKLSVSVVNGIAKISVIDKNWMGAEVITFTATDQGGLSNQESVIFNQTDTITQNTWAGKPVVSFVAEKTVVGVSDPVYFHGSITGAVASQGYVWTFAGGKPAQSFDMNPVVTYAKPGKYDVLFVAANSVGTDSAETNNYISVIGITTPDTTICKGTGITLRVSDSSLKYIWSNGATTASISVTPTVNTTYSVTAQYGLFEYFDSVKVSVSKPVSLGNDTAICEGSSLLIKVGGYSSYVWNGNSSLTTNSFTASTAQKVSVETKDAFGCVSKDSMQVSVNALPTVSLGANDSICPSVNKVLDAGKGFASYSWNDGTSAEALTVTKSEKYSVTVTDGNGCKNSSSVTEVIKQPYAEPLGVATVLGNNRIVVAWNRTPGKNTASYDVLRETDVTNVYAKIGSTSINDKYSYVVDSNVSALQQSYRYELVTFDNCKDSAVSPFHQTMLLLPGTNNSKGNNLQWSAYLGIDAISTYNIYRNGTLIHSIASDQLAYIDVEGVAGDSYYIGYVLPNTIDPSKLKSDAGPFSQSLSNMAESQLTGVAINTSDVTIEAYPNPTKEILTVAIGSNSAKAYTVAVINNLGETVFTINTIETLVTIDGSKLASGLYTVKVQSDKGVTTKQVVIAR